MGNESLIYMFLFCIDTHKFKDIQLFSGTLSLWLYWKLKYDKSNYERMERNYKMDGIPENLKVDENRKGTLHRKLELMFIFV